MIVAIQSRPDPGAVANENADATPAPTTQRGLAPPQRSLATPELRSEQSALAVLDEPANGAPLGGIYTAPFGFVLRATVNHVPRSVPVVIDDPGQLDAIARALSLVSGSGGFEATARSSCRVEALIRLPGTHGASAASSIRALSGELLERASDALPEELALSEPLALSLSTIADGTLVVCLALEAPADQHLENALYGAACAIAPALSRLAEVSPNVRVVRKAIERFHVRCQIRAERLIEAALAPAGFRLSARSREEAIFRATAALSAGGRDGAVAQAHNGLVASGIAAVALAFGNSPVRVVADAEHHAARSGGCEPLCTWRAVGDAVAGELELPLGITTHGRWQAPSEPGSSHGSTLGATLDIGMLAACLGMASSVVALEDAVRVRVHDGRSTLAREREPRRARPDAEPPSVASL